MIVNKPPPKMNIEYKIPAIVIMSDVGVVVESLLNHRLSEKDTDEDCFLILLDISIPILDQVFSTSLAHSPVNEFF
jgi:hypothetical protein